MDCISLPQKHASKSEYTSSYQSEPSIVQTENATEPFMSLLKYLKTSWDMWLRTNWSYLCQYAGVCNHKKTPHRNKIPTTPKSNPIRKIHRCGIFQQNNQEKESQINRYDIILATGPQIIRTLTYILDARQR